jgi:hypothetical protein
MPAPSAREITMSIQGLDARHSDAAAATLGEAFFDDRLLQIVSPDEATRLRGGPWFMSLTVQYGLRWGEVWGTNDTSAVAVWGAGRQRRDGPWSGAPDRIGQNAVPLGDRG